MIINALKKTESTRLIIGAAIDIAGIAIGALDGLLLRTLGFAGAVLRFGLALRQAAASVCGIQGALLRALLQLHQAGVLAQQKAIVLGAFTEYRKSPLDRGYNLKAVIAHLRSVCPVPILTGLPFGHVPVKVCLPVGLGLPSLSHWGHSTSVPFGLRGLSSSSCSSPSIRLIHWFTTTISMWFSPGFSALVTSTR